VLGVLTLVYTQQQWSRYSLNYLAAVDPSKGAKRSIRSATGLTFAQYGVLTGYGFSATFCVAGLFAGRAADVASRTLIIFAGALIWNGALAMIGSSTNFVELLLWRLALGFGQALSNPASYSLLADVFPEEQRAQANGLFACGVYLGGGLASLCLNMATALGWRTACFVVAALGLLLAFLQALLIAEPSRATTTKAAAGAAAAAQEKQEKKQKKNQGPQLLQGRRDGRRDGRDASQDASQDSSSKAGGGGRTLSMALKTIFSSDVVVTLFLAAAFRFCGGFAIGGYMPTTYDAVFPGYATQYSYVNAYVVAFGGFLSSWLGGLVADEWKKTEPRARLYVPALGCVAAIPFLAVCCLASNFYVSILLGLFLEYLVAECWFGPVVAAVQSALPPDCRALAIACFTLIATFFGSLASYLIGLVYDKALRAGQPPDVIRWILLWSVTVSYLAAAALFLLASRFVRNDSSSSSLQGEKKPLLTDDDIDTTTCMKKKKKKKKNSSDDVEETY